MEPRHRFHHALVLSAFFLACLGGAGRLAAAPTLDPPIPDRCLLPNGSNATINLGSYFSGAESYSASSSDTDVVDTSVSGSTLTLDPGDAGSATITVIATDTDTNPDTTLTTTFTVVVNTAPVFLSPQSSIPDLEKNNTPMTEDETLTIGVNSNASVEDNLLGGIVTFDTDSDTLGIAVTGYAGNGTWQYLNGSSVWTDLGSVSSSSAFLLGSTNRLRYNGDLENAETATLTYRLWDGSAGAAFSSADTSTNGGCTPFSSDTRTSDVPVTAVQDPAEIVVVSSAVTGNDDTATSPFTDVEINDVDRNPSDTLTVTVTVSPKSQGSLAQGGTPAEEFAETGVDTGIYTVTGTEAEVEEALQDLEFRPVANLVAVGSTTDTGLLIEVSDNATPTGTDDSATVTATITSVNDAPVVAGGAANQFVFTRSSLLPFTGVTISDVDVVSGGGRQNVTLTVTKTEPSGAGGGWVQANGTESTANTLTFTNISIESAITELENLVYVATTSTLDDPVDVTLGLTVTDVPGSGNALSDSASFTVTVATPKVTTNIRGTSQDQIIPDKSEKRIFENVVITGTTVASVEVSAIVASTATNVLASPAAGSFFEDGVSSPQFTLTGNTLVFTGAASDATTAIRRIAFRPTSNFFSAPETIQFKIELKDDNDGSLGIDDQTTALVVPVNDLPTFIRFQGLDPITDAETVAPFPRVVIGDVDEKGLQRLAVDVEVVSSLPPGTVSDDIPGTLSGGSFTVDGSNDALYHFEGTPAEVTTAIQALIFTPTANRLEPGRNETVTFKVVIDDDVNASDNDLVVRNQVRVLVVSENDEPVVTDVPPARREVVVVESGAILPFVDTGMPPAFELELSDADLNDELTITIRLDDSEKGFLSDTSGTFSETSDGSGVYRGTGLPMDVLTALQGLVFNLDPGYPVPAGAPGILVNFEVTVADRLGLNTSFSFALLLRIEQVARVVTNTDDSGPGSLRQAILDANTNDHIVFDLATQFETEPTLTIRLQSPLVIGENLTIIGPGAEKLFLSGDSDGDGEPDVQIFQVGVLETESDPAVAAYLHLSRITLIQGSDVDSEFGNGGAISVGRGSTLVVDHVEFLECFAEQWGGAIDVNGGRIDVSHALFAGNRTGEGVGRGGGAVSVLSNSASSFVNTTFSGNVQGAANGAGGGALYLENTDPGLPAPALVGHCTFVGNVDAAEKGSSIRTNVFNMRAELVNCLFADGTDNPLDPSGAGRILSLGGNVADDDTEVVISQGGLSFAIILLDQSTDLTEQALALEPLADCGGQVRGHALPSGSPARNAGIGGTGIATDQRDVWRDGSPHSGAMETRSFRRVVINEIQFDPDVDTDPMSDPDPDASWIEIVNPRDSEDLNLGGYELWVQGIHRHTFKALVLVPGTGILVKDDAGDIMPVPPGGFTVAGGNLQVASVDGSLGLGSAGGIVEIRTPDPDGAGDAIGDVVASATYLASFFESGASTELRGTNESVTRNCEFLGGFLPGPATPGEDGSRVPLLEGNAPPIAFDDKVDSDEDTVLEIDVLANDFDADRTDVIRVESLPSAKSTLGAQLSIVNMPSVGAAIEYDPTDPEISAVIQSLPVGAQAIDTFDYVILDYAGGTTANARVRNPPIDVLPDEQDEFDANLERATGTVSVCLTGVNDAPTPQDDSPIAVNGKPATDTDLVTMEDVVLTFAADNLLLNDTDPDDGESGSAGPDTDIDPNGATLVTPAGRLRICWVKPYGFLLEDKDPTRVELSDLVTTSEKGARVELVIRADRSQSTITYDPTGSAVLDALAAGEKAIDRFSYLVIDPHGAPGIATVCIEVTGVNDAPVANDDSGFATDEDHDLTIVPADLLANDTDVDQDGKAPDDELSVVSVSSSAWDAVVRIEGGVVVYDPTVSADLVIAADPDGVPRLQMLSKKEVIVDSFEYTIDDGNGGSATAIAYVQVTGVNDRPDAIDDVYTGSLAASEDDPVSYSDDVGVLANDEDIDMNGTSPDDVLRALPVATFTTTLGATVMLHADGSFEYDPDGMFEGLAMGQTAEDSFYYDATDDTLVWAGADSFRVESGAAGVFLDVLFNDVNLSQDPGPGLVVTGVSTTDRGGVVEVTADGDGVLYTPAFGFVGTETFTYLIADGPNGFCMAEVSVSVQPSGGPLAAKADHFQVAPNGTADLDVLANDLGSLTGVSLILESLTAPDKGGTATIAFVGGRTVVRYTPVPGFTGTETFAYTASAGGGLTITGSVTVVVPDRTDDLRAVEDVFLVVVGSGENVLPVLANDGVLPATAANWFLDAGLLGTPSAGGSAEVAADGRSVAYTPAASMAAGDTETFSYAVADAYGGTGTAMVTIVAIGDGLSAADDAFTVNWNSTNNTLPVLANDELVPDDGEKIEITFVQDPDDGTATWNASRSAIVYTPDAGFAGTDSFTYEIGAATHPRRAATVTVTVVDRSLELASADDFYCVAGFITDPDTGAVIAGNSGRNALRVLANDVLPPLSTPALSVTDDVITPTEGGLVESGNGGAFLFYTPAANFVGTDTFTYTFGDGRGGTGTAQVTVKVGSVFAGDDAFTVLEDTSDNFLDVLANDARIPGGAPELAGLVAAPDQGGTVVPNDAGDAFIYGPAAGFTGIETFTYAVLDDSGESYKATVRVRVLPENDRDEALVTIDVTGANDAPTITGTEPIDFQRDDRDSKPFANVVIKEVDDGGNESLTVKVVLDDPAKGEMVTLGTDPPSPAPFVEAPDGTFTFVGTAADATAALQALCFVPTDGRIEWSEHETTTLTLCVSDPYVEVKDSNTTIEVYNIGQLFGDNWIFGNGCTLSWDERRNLTKGHTEPFGFPLGGGGSWSDPDTGEWLLYTDGVSAWDAQTGVPIAGADGTLGASPGEDNNIPAMIVPKPGGDPRVNLYVFAFGAGNKNIHFTEIDLDAGTVVGEAGRIVFNTSPSQQGWVIVPQANDVDYWMILGNGDAYPVTASGVGAVPVPNFNLDGSGGSFRYSPDRTRIAVSWSSPKLYVYDFDAATGQFGAASRLELPMGNAFFEFSHDGTKLYVNDTDTGALYQYDLGADPGTGATTEMRSAAVVASEVLLQTWEAPDYAGDLALGPDGRIYVVGDGSSPPKLHVIAEPNEAGTDCNLLLDEVELAADCQLRQGLYHGLRVDDLIDVTQTPPEPEILLTGVAPAVSTAAWTTVTLPQSYASMVVVATPQLVAGQIPVVPRIQNAAGNSFEITLAPLDPSAVLPVTAPVHYLVVEEGVYNVFDHGIAMEAVRFESTVTDRKGSWLGQPRPYQQAYNNPVVIGQVMTSNDPRFSMFWSLGTNPTNPPTKNTLSVGKHVASDPVTQRANETIGYLVLETGAGVAGTRAYTAFVGADSVRGVGDAPPYTYPVSGIVTPLAAVVSSAAMDDNDGGWPVLYGASPLANNAIAVAIDEDRLADAERSHSTEQVAVLVIGDAGTGGSGNPLVINASEASLRDWRGRHFDEAELANPLLEGVLWGLMADPDGDGRLNLEEYAFDLDPRRLDAAASVRIWMEPVPPGSASDSGLRLSFRRRSEDGLLRYVIERSIDLRAWEAVTAREVDVFTLSDSGYERIVLELPEPDGSGGRAAQFRVRIVR